MRQQYNKLRATIERVVECLVLNETVRRFSGYIQVKKLEKVVGLERSEYEAIFELYQRCHEVTEAHDPSDILNEPPPTPSDLKRDIEDLNKLIQDIKDRRKRIKN